MALFALDSRSFSRPLAPERRFPFEVKEVHAAGDRAWVLLASYVVLLEQSYHHASPLVTCEKWHLWSYQIESSCSNDTI